MGVSGALPLTFWFVFAHTCVCLPVCVCVFAHIGMDKGVMFAPSACLAGVSQPKPYSLLAFQQHWVLMEKISFVINLQSGHCFTDFDKWTLMDHCPNTLSSTHRNVTKVRSWAHSTHLPVELDNAVMHTSTKTMAQHLLVASFLWGNFNPIVKLKKRSRRSSRNIVFGQRATISAPAVVGPTVNVIGCALCTVIVRQEC